jgi:hypothetical protein
MADEKKLAAVGLLGLAAWLWAKGWGQTGAMAPSSPPLGAGTDDSKIHLMYCVQGADNLYSDGGFILSDKQPDAIDVAAERAQLGNGQSMAGRTLGSAMWGMYNQIYLPASRVKDADLQPYHFQLCNAMLSGLISRDDKSGRLYQRLLDDVAQNKKDQQDLQTANQVISGVAAVIPVIGGVIKLATSTGINEGIKGEQANILHDLDAANTINTVKTGLGLGSPDAKAWLANGKNGGPEQPIEQQWVHADNGVIVNVCSIGLTELGGYNYGPPDGGPVGQASAGKYVTTTTNGYTRDVWQFNPGYGFQPVACRMRLFSMHSYGWLLPWLSSELSSGEGVARQIAIIAPVFRAFDRLCCSQDPMAPPPDGKGDPNRYWYTSATFGNMMGSVFPPQLPGDTRLQHGLNYLGWHGEDQTAGVIGAFSTLAYKGPSVTQAAESGAATSIVGGSTGTTGTAPAGEDYGQAAGLQAAASALAVNSTPSLPTLSIVKGYR